MKIRVTLHSTHPHFGGHEIQSWDYAMEFGKLAEEKYEALKKEIGTSGYAHLDIQIVTTS